MNKRLLELYGQAMTNSWGEELDPELFAQLIVRECMSVANGMRNPPNLNYKPGERFVDELRLHFGVH